jgi:hypothetical protein
MLEHCRADGMFTPQVCANLGKAEVGFEPTNNGFAIRPLRPLGYSAVAGHILSSEMPPVNEPRPQLMQVDGICRDRCGLGAVLCALLCALLAVTGVGRHALAQSSEGAQSPSRPPIDVARPAGSQPIEPAAAAQSGTWLGPSAMQEAAEIRASGFFLPPVIPEGGFLMRAVGTLERRPDLGVWAIRLRDRINGAPNRIITLLPCQALTDMIDATRAASEAGESCIFEVTGRIMAWRGANFLLVSFAVPVTTLDAPRTDAAPLMPPGAMRSAPEPAPAARSETVTESSAPTAPAAAAPGTEVAAAATSATSAEAAPEPTDPENVATQLERALDSRVTTIARSSDAQPAAALAEPGSVQPSRAAQPVGSELSSAIRDPSASEPLGPDGLPLPRAGTDAPQSGEDGASDGASDAPDAGTPPDGAAPLTEAIGGMLPSAPASARLMPPQRMLDRRGTVTRDPVTGAWIFVLASGGLHEGDHALELLPCTALDRLISMTRSAPQTMSVVLTGEVTLFEGRNYLRPVRMRALREGRWIGP